MQQYHVWIDESGNYKAIETGHMNSVEEIDRAIGGYNWYGLDAFSKEDAIAKAKQSGLKYRSPKEMSKLMDKCLNLQAQVSEFIA